MSYTESVVETMAADGFAVLRRFIDDDTVEAARQHLDELLVKGPSAGVQPIRGDSPEPTARKIKDVAQSSEFFMRLATSPRFAATATTALDCEEARLFSSTAWMKPARVGPAKPPHQDTAHWLHIDPPLFVTIWVALDASTRQNGCLNFERGSHMGPIYRHTREGDFLIKGWRSSDGVAAELEPGDASVHFGRTVHWSEPNRSGDQRRGVAFAYCVSGIRSRLPELDVTTLALVRRGE